MPFTLAHPAAVIPLYRLLGCRASPSALVIGSMIPDLVYFVPLGIGSRFSHSTNGLIWFCVPMGIVAFALFHLILKQPLADLLPSKLGARLPASTWTPLPEGASLYTVSLSLALGALTHVAWDNLTHAHTIVVRQAEILRMVVFRFEDHSIAVYKLLQYASSIFGLAVCGWWIRRAMSVPLKMADYPKKLSRAERWCVLAAILLSGFGSSILGLPKLWNKDGELFVARLVVLWMAGAGFGACFYCLAWHLWKPGRWEQRAAGFGQLGGSCRD